MTAKKISPNRRSRTVRWQDPMVTVEAISTMSGLDFLQAMKDGEMSPPILSLVGFRLAEFAAGHIVFEFDPAEYHYNPAGTVQGGIVCAVLDAAATCAGHSTLPAGQALTTLEIKTNFLRPIRSETGLMRCEATLIHKGSRIAVAEAKMRDGNGLLYAYAVSTCLIFEATKEGAKAGE